MNESIDLMASVLEAGTESEFLKSLQAAAIECGFDATSVSLQWLGPQGEVCGRVCSSFPASWQRIYQERGYSEIDPTVAHCLSSTEPLLWTASLFAHSNHTMHLLEAARAHGLGHGISIPTHDALGLKSAVALARRQAIEPRSTEAAQLLRKAKVIAAFAHIAFRNLIRGELSADCARPLSDQEKTCLRWVATGKTSWEVGMILKISESTVIFHIKNAMDKLGVKSRAQAIAVAFRLGLLN